MVIDTLTGPNDKWSRKSITWLIGIVLFCLEVIFHLMTGRAVQIDIIYATVALILGIGVMSVVDKMKNGSTGSPTGEIKE